MVADILASVARQEIEQKSDRQKRQALQAAEQGVPHKTRIRAFGFLADGVTHHPIEADALRRAYGSFLAGRTLVGLCRDLASEGILTPAGKPFNHNAIKSILLNARNAGIRTYTTKISGKNATREIGPAQWQPIVDLDTFRAVEAILKDPTRREGKDLSGARRWLLGGLALCGECSGTTVKVNYKGTPKGMVRLYQCRNSAHLSRKADWCDDLVSEVIIGRLSREDAADLLVDNDRPNVDDLRQQANAHRLRRTQLAEDFADGTITHDVFKAGTGRATAKINDLEAQMAHVDRAPILADLVNADDVRAAWETIGLDRQRSVIDTLCTVTLLRRPPGRYKTPPETIKIDWK